MHSKGDACDVENFFEYEDVVKKIVERKPTKAVTISIDMKDVEKAAKKSADSEQDTDDGIDEQVEVRVHALSQYRSNFIEGIDWALED
jgi:hypothetical protein